MVKANNNEVVCSNYNTVKMTQLFSKTLNPLQLNCSSVPHVYPQYKICRSCSYAFFQNSSFEKVP